MERKKMKKRVVAIIATATACIMMVGCTPKEEKIGAVKKLD